ncbi:MAG: enoyl-CoA hydratase-related protein [Candidatus Hydrogenedentota bacterium]
MSQELVIKERFERWIRLTLNRLPVNALAIDLLRGLREAIEQAEADAAIRSVVITGAGRVFCAGADLPTLQASIGDPFAEGGLLQEGIHAMDRIAECSKPVIAAVNGAALGGGCELALACHLRIASDKAKFGQPEINLGVMPGWGGTYRLPAAVGVSRGLDWLLTGKTIRAQEAYDAGLVSYLVPHDEFEDAYKRLAVKLAAQPPAAIRAILRVVRGCALDPGRGKELELEAFAEVARTEDAAEGVQAFLEKRAPTFSSE